MNMDSDMVYRKGTVVRSTLAKKPNETMRVFITICVGIMFGFFIGVSFPSLPFTKLNITSALLRDFVIIGNKSAAQFTDNSSNKSSTANQTVIDVSKIWVPSNPKGAERLPPGIVASESDLYLRRLWGKPSEDLTSKPNYLVTFTVGYDQRKNIDAAVKKDIEREKKKRESPEAMEEDDVDDIPEIKAAHFEESMKFARRSVSDADIRKYQLFAQTLQQSRGIGSEFRFADRADTSAAGRVDPFSSAGGGSVEDDDLYG